MIQEDKELLIKDLCGRLPYGVILNCCNTVGERLTAIDENGLINHDYDIDEVKPLLFPLSSMTEEQRKFFNNLPIGIDKYGDISTKDDISGNSLYTDLELYLEVIEWLNANHFDYRGLIEKGLAIDATELNIY